MGRFYHGRPRHASGRRPAAEIGLGRRCNLGSAMATSSLPVRRRRQSRRPVSAGGPPRAHRAGESEQVARGAQGAAEDGLGRRIKIA
jgi:hypothetical protein